MFLKLYNFVLRILFCTFTFHSSSETPVQSHREFHIFACKRCGNLFSKKKNKYKSK